MKNTGRNNLKKESTAPGRKRISRRPGDKYYGLLENMTDGFSSVDMNGVIRETNIAFQQMLGYSPDELQHLTYRDLTPDRWHAFEQKILDEQVLHKGHSVVYEKEYRRKDGIIFPVELRTTLIRNKAGENEGMWAIVRDITERKRIQGMLRNSERTIAQITDNIPVNISLVSRNLEYTFVNKGYEDFFNLERNELIGKKVNELLDPKAFERAYPYITRAFAGESCDFENCLTTKDGVEHTMQTIYAPYYQNDVITGIIILARDITDRKRTDAKLIQIMAAFESTSDAIGIADAQGKQIYQNKAFSDLFGYFTAEELEAAGGISLLIKDPAVKKELFDNIMNGIPWEGELERVTKDRKVFPAYERADAIKDESGNIIGLIGIIRDITERNRINEAIRRSEIEYRSTLDALPEWIYVVDENLCFVMLNHSLQHEFHHYGIVTDCIGSKITGTFPLISSQSIKDIEQVFRTGEQLISERKVKLNGKTLFCELIKVPVFQDQKVIKVITVIRDRSKEKEIEVLKQKSADEKEILLREIHHRVKNNLSIVISLLNFQLTMSKSQELIPIINDIQLRIRSIALIHEHLYRSETLDRIPLVTYIQSLADIIHSTISPSDLKIETRLDPVDVSIQTALPIGLIINELLTNAVKYAFTPGKKGEIDIILEKDEEDMCTLIVKDNGIGLPLNYSLESVKTMGFYIIHLLTEQLEGEMEILRQNGTSFILRFRNKF